MNKPDNGLYMAKVTDEGVAKMHADEDAVADHQTAKIFDGRDQNRAKQEKEAANKMREADEQLRRANCQNAKRKRCLWYMVKDVLGLICTALLVMAIYHYGLYVAIAAVTGCAVAAFCRVTGYIEKQGGTYEKV